MRSSNAQVLHAPIIVIGAGTAGLTLARTLTDHAVPVIVLEARNRIGGRVWTTHEIASAPVELGAEWIHGDHAPT